jgi:hypothetical protein
MYIYSFLSHCIKAEAIWLYYSSSCLTLSLSICVCFLHLSSYLFYNWPVGCCVSIFSPPLAPHFGAWGWFISFLIILQTVRLLGQVIGSLQGLYLNTGQHKHRKPYTHTHTHTHQTSMPSVGFEPTIPASERAKTVHAPDGSATVTGLYKHTIK